MIYLDYSANTPADPAVLDAFCRTEQTYIGNPNSAHPAGRAAQAEMARATEGIAALLGVSPEEIIYTSGASESNNLALKGIAQASRHVGRHILSTALEHSSVGGALSALQQQGCEVDLVDIGRDGTVDLEHLRELLRRDTVLVSVCAVDSELGTVQPIREIAAVLKDYPNCRFHVDAAQAVGKTGLVLDGVDTMSVAPHKFYGLNGSGLLVKRKDLVIEPQIHGGVSTTIYRSGTPALGLAVSIEKALRLALDADFSRESISPRKKYQDFAMRAHSFADDPPLQMPAPLLREATLICETPDGPVSLKLKTSPDADRVRGRSFCFQKRRPSRWA